ncbi:MAG: EpsG family protein [Butyrivibrio sp.]|uniref:EpsG family protein n=1 Tax=Butyrivibrio sp. TaxID=28121 RepID=UPI001B28B600|nr:EpsG family protein [Butyrivibrio sp.]MBO6242190.1 EpsG family protein [Butyrivibrio sp.]
MYIICVGVLVLWVMLRDYSIGADTISYLRLKKYIVDDIDDLKNLFTDWKINDYWKYEKGFSAFCYFFFRYISDSDSMFIIVTALIGLLPVFILIYNKSEHIFLSLFMFVVMGMYSYSFNVIRQFMAIGLTSTSYMILKNNESRASKKIIGTAFFLAAVSIHTSAVLFALVFVYDIFFSKWLTPRRMLIMYGAEIAILILVDGIVMRLVGKLNKYADFIVSGNKSIYTVIILNCVFVYIIVAASNRLFNDDNELLFLLFLYLSFNTLGLFFSLIVRVGLYFLVGAVVGIPNLMLRENSKISGLVMTIVIMFFLIQYTKSLIGDAYLVPYSINLEFF